MLISFYTHIQCNINDFILLYFFFFVGFENWKTSTATWKQQKFKEKRDSVRERMIKRETATECVCVCVVAFFGFYSSLCVWCAITEWVVCEKEMQCNGNEQNINNNNQTLQFQFLPQSFVPYRVVTHRTYLHVVLIQYLIPQPDLTSTTISIYPITWIEHLYILHFLAAAALRIETIATQSVITPIIITFILTHRCFAVCKRQVNQKWWWAWNSHQFFCKQENISTVWMSNVEFYYIICLT